jgi:hypothetical protein
MGWGYTEQPVHTRTIGGQSKGSCGLQEDGHGKAIRTWIIHQRKNKTNFGTNHPATLDASEVYGSRTDVITSNDDSTRSSVEPKASILACIRNQINALSVSGTADRDFRRPARIKTSDPEHKAKGIFSIKVTDPFIRIKPRAPNQSCT